MLKLFKQCKYLVFLVYMTLYWRSWQGCHFFGTPCKLRMNSVWCRAAGRRQRESVSAARSCWRRRDVRLPHWRPDCLVTTDPLVSAHRGNTTYVHTLNVYVRATACKKRKQNSQERGKLTGVFNLKCKFSYCQRADINGFMLKWFRDPFPVPSITSVLMAEMSALKMLKSLSSFVRVFSDGTSFVAAVAFCWVNLRSLRLIRLNVP